MLAVAVAAGVLLGLSLGALGGGGSILAVPVLVYLLDQEPLVATTGSLVIVGISSASGAFAAWREGNVQLGRGLVFASVGLAGAAAGGHLSTRVDPDVLLGLFALLMLIVAGVMITRQLRSRRTEPDPDRATRPEPIVRLRPTFSCNCPVVVKLIVSAVLVGFMTGFFGVGGGFLVVPALVLTLDMAMPVAVGTSLLVITIESAAAFATRMSSGVALPWGALAALTVAAVLGSVAGAKLGTRIDPRKLGLAFSVLLVVVGGYMAWKSVPALIT
jgi:uncharacterized membrane protein YfcA